MTSTSPPYYLEHVFEKPMSIVDVNHRFAYPVKHIQHVRPNPYENRDIATEFKIIDGDGNPYHLRLTVRRNGPLKPEITGDWLRFVRDKAINPLDVVIFMKHNPVRNGVVFTVNVRRAFFVCTGVLGNSELG